MDDITLDDPFAKATAPGEAASAVRGVTLHWMFLDLAISLHSVFFNTHSVSFPTATVVTVVPCSQVVVSLCLSRD